MSKKFQIFVSSTYEDLKSERDQVIKAALEMGHIPVGMEMFSAADEEQWKIIARQIDQSDYYAVIIAHRYGSVHEGVSYTEKEYDYALSKGIPVIGFVIEDGVHWPPVMIDTDHDARVSLERFKAKVKKKPVGFWKNSEDLHGKFSISLMKLIATNPRLGWARADEVAGPELARELTRLSSENAKLRDEIAILNKREEEHESNKDQDMIKILQKNKTRICYRKDERDAKWQDHKDTTLFSIFSAIAHKLISEASIISIRQELAFKFFNYESHRHYPIPRNYVDHWINDFSCLGLVMPSRKKHSVNDDNDYWALTENGFRVHSSLRRLELEVGTEIDVNDEPDDDL
ncbi:DUF4062 domain-containing protein [Gynuella sunshinyii]|uniref:DUF4062 domain-containing protein n=1 Tax=Gynuella sunshinyii YC6258 TaxID=1445510 RepID=A0A0C5V847_9GAMM|nr:DUF4062 domain-containing protein [Gynuella sunshinyii]AJQ95580.1 hypothetical Protein YC6258_03544 [Gynuella sunshinyii YC6258]